MKLKRCMLVAGVAALAVSPMVMKPAFAVTQPMAEKIVAVDKTKTKKDDERTTRNWGMLVSGIVIGGLIVLAGIDPPAKTEEDEVRSRFLSHG